MLAGVRARLGVFASQVRAATALAAQGLGVAAAASAGLGAAIVAASNSLSKLGDRAAQAGMTADELARLSTALKGAGARGADIESIAQGLARMAQTTGRTGLAGLRETLAEISQLGDEGARVRELSRVFGRSFGPGLAATVRQGPDALMEGFDGVLGMMPGLRNEAADMGDRIADGFQIAKDGVLRTVQTLLVEIGDRFFKKLGMTARGFGVLVAEYASVYGELILANLGPLWDRISAAVKNLPRLVTAGLVIIRAKIGDAVLDIGQKLGLVLAAIAAIQLATGNVVGAGILVAADVALAAGLDKLEAGVKEAKEKAAEAQKEIDAYFAGARPFVGLTDEQKQRIEDAEKKAKEINSAFDKFTSGRPGSSLAGDIAAALGPVRDAQAVLAGSYQAFKIASQRGLGGSNGGLSAERATLDTAKNTATLARNSERQLRATEKLASAVDSAGGLLTIA